MANLSREQEKLDVLRERLISLLEKRNSSYHHMADPGLKCYIDRVREEMIKQENIVTELVKADIIFNFFAGGTER